MRRRRYGHGLGHYRLLTLDMGQLIPISSVEVLPGDSFRHSSAALIRVTPLVAPVMHPVQVRIHHWFVPNRLVWDGWEKFITGQDEVTPHPTVTPTPRAEGDLADYMGIPPLEGLEVSALPFRAYNLVFNEFYRDQDLVLERDLDEDTDVPHVAWEKDYFTTSRPWAQKGDAVSVPIDVEGVPIVGFGNHAAAVYTQGSNVNVEESGGNDAVYASHLDSSSPGGLVMEEDPANPGYPRIRTGAGGNINVDVEQLREAFALQRYNEARARYGSRYVEYLEYLGIRPRDGRLDRPEYLGGGKSLISFSEVLATAQGTSTNVGDMAGHGILALRTRPYRRFFEEHGHIISVMSIRPKSIYMNALHRSWLRRTKEDYWQKELEALGQQAVTTRELYAGAVDPTTVFGYVDRYREYREQPSIVAGAFRSTEAHWHYARDFQAEPVLNESFIDCVPTDRVYAAADVPELQVMVSHRMRATRMVKPRGGQVGG